MKRITSLAPQRGTSGLAFDTGAGRAGHLCGCGPYGSCAGRGKLFVELPQADTPDMSNTVRSFAGGYIDGGEMTQAEMDESLAAYGGTAQFTFDAAGGAKMIQGGVR